MSTWGKVLASFHLICFFPLRAVDGFQGHVFTENVKYHPFTRAELTPDLGSDKYHLRCWVHGAGLLMLWFSALATLRTLPRNPSDSRSCSPVGVEHLLLLAITGLQSQAPCGCPISSSVFFLCCFWTLWVLETLVNTEVIGNCIECLLFAMLYDMYSPTVISLNSPNK